MAVFPDEDRVTYPDMFALPTGCYEVVLPRPLGIAFEEHEPGRGVVVEYLVEDSHAEKCGQIQPGDVLIAVTAHKASACLSVELPYMPTYLPIYLSIYACLPTPITLPLHLGLCLSPHRMPIHLPSRRPQR